MGAAAPALRVGTGRNGPFTAPTPLTFGNQGQPIGWTDDGFKRLDVVKFHGLPTLSRQVSEPPLTVRV